LHAASIWTQNRPVANGCADEHDLHLDLYRQCSGGQRLQQRLQFLEVRIELGGSAKRTRTFT